MSKQVFPLSVNQQYRLIKQRKMALLLDVSIHVHTPKQS